MKKQKLFYNDVLLKELIRGRLEYSLSDCVRIFKVSKAAMSRLINGTYKNKQGSHVNHSTILTNIVERMQELGIDNAQDILKPHKKKQTKKTNKKRRYIMDHKTLKFWSFPTNPFDIDEFEHKIWMNEEVSNVYNTMMFYATKKKFLIVSGDVGTGKSGLLIKLRKQLANRKKIKVCYQSQLLVEKINTNWIADALIEEYHRIKPPQKNREKTIGVNKVLRESQTTKTTIVLLLDEVHKLVDDTLLILKRFWEGNELYRYHIGIILMAQPKIEQTYFDPAFDEVRLRSELIHLKPFHKLINDKWIIQTSYVRDFINFKLSLIKKDGIFTDDAINKISIRCSTPLQVCNLCSDALVAAAEVGEKQITREIIDAV